MLSSWQRPTSTVPTSTQKFDTILANNLLNYDGTANVKLASQAITISASNVITFESNVATLTTSQGVEVKQPVFANVTRTALLHTTSDTLNINPDKVAFG